MSDWQVGDLALCVDDSPCRITPFPGAPWRIPAGTVCKVVAIGRICPKSGPSLILSGYRASYHDMGFGFAARRFRKIRPDEHQACEPEFVTLLKRTKHQVPA